MKSDRQLTAQARIRKRRRADRESTRALQVALGNVPESQARHLERDRTVSSALDDYVNKPARTVSSALELAVGKPVVGAVEMGKNVALGSMHTLGTMGAVGAATYKPVELYMDYFGPGAMIDSSFRAADAAYKYVLAPAADAAYGYGLAAVAGAASRGRKVRNVIPSRRLTNKDDSEPEPEPTRLNNKARLEIFKQHLIDKRDNESLD
jgi:hypothetical protein